MRLNTFTKIMLVVALAGSQVSAFAVRAGNVYYEKAAGGIAPPAKVAAAIWKQAPEQLQQLVVSAQNAGHAFVTKEKEYNFLKGINTSVGTASHAVESPAFSKMYHSTASYAGFAQSPEARQLPSVNAYPNPSRGKTRLALTNFGYDNYRIRVSNTIGKVVQTVDLSGADAAEVELDLSKYPAGVYFYSLMVNDKTVETKRLILQK